MTDRITIAIHKGIVSEVIIPDDADVEVVVVDFDSEESGEPSEETHRNAIGFKRLYELSTDDVKTLAESAVDFGEDEITEEQMEYILGDGLRTIEKSIDAGMQDWDTDIRIGIEIALEEFKGIEATL